MWLESDTQAALEWMEYRSSLCGGCGLPRSETMDPDRSGMYEAEVWQCHACAPKDAAGRHASEAKSDGKFSTAAFDGIYIAVVEKGVTDG